MNDGDPPMNDDKRPTSCVLHEQQLNRIESTVQTIHNRLFLDNGAPCIQTRLDRHDAAINVLKWLAGTLGATTIAALVKVWFLIAAAVVVLAGATGCASWRPDGQVAGVVPVDALEAPINLVLPGAGTALVKLDRAALPRLAGFPLESVATNYFDANNQEIVPPFRKVETPVYGPRVTQLGDAQPSAPKLDAAALLQAIQAAQQASPAVSAPTATGTLSDAERAALEALGVKLP